MHTGTELQKMSDELERTWDRMRLMMILFWLSAIPGLATTLVSLAACFLEIGPPWIYLSAACALFLIMFAVKLRFQDLSGRFYNLREMLCLLGMTGQAVKGQDRD